MELLAGKDEENGGPSFSEAEEKKIVAKLVESNFLMPGEKYVDLHWGERLFNQLALALDEAVLSAAHKAVQDPGFPFGVDHLREADLQLRLSETEKKLEKDLKELRESGGA